MLSLPETIQLINFLSRGARMEIAAASVSTLNILLRVLTQNSKDTWCTWSLSRLCLCHILIFPFSGSLAWVPQEDVQPDLWVDWHGIALTVVGTLFWCSHGCQSVFIRILGFLTDLWELCCTLQLFPCSYWTWTHVGTKKKGYGRCCSCKGLQKSWFMLQQNKSDLSSYF